MNYQDIDFDIEELAEPEAAYKVNRELNLAWRIIEETGANLFLTGRAGTGKTTFLRRLRENSSKRMVVLAPTGVAAINAGGNTIHSFFQLPFSPYIPGKGFLGNDKRYFNFSKQKRRLIASLSLLVIDEVSMVRPDTLDAIDSILRRLRTPYLPFGGVQLLLIGDLRQLPPVVNESEKEHLEAYYPSPYFFDSHALKQSGFQALELTTVYRQTDGDFINILNAIRDGKADQDTLSRLNSRIIPGFDPDDSEGYIRLTTHNRIASSFNDSRMRALPSPPATYEAQVTGDFPESNYPADYNLTLKEGARVMFIKNDVGAARRYYNGLIGTVVSLDGDSIGVRPDGSGEIINVERAEWENTRYAIDEKSKKICQDTIGVFSQYPLRPAWAITIHKSQGLTFDKAIIDASLSFAAGQTYVALSRCRSLEGLVLSSYVPPHAIITDRQVNDFIDYCGRNAPDTGTINALRSQYLRMLLAELFDFSTLSLKFDEFSRNVTEYIVPIYPSIRENLDEMREKIRRDLRDVGARFISLYASAPIDPEGFEANRTLLDRIRKGCNYFMPILKEAGAFINRLPRDIDNRSYAERLNNTFDNLWFELRLKSILMPVMAERDFSTSVYTNAKAEALLDMEGGKSANKPAKTSAKQSSKTAARKNNVEKKERQKAEKKPKGYSKFESLKLFQSGLDIKEIAERRQLAAGTVATHLADLAKEGILKTENLISASFLAEIEKLIADNPGLPFKDIKEAYGKLHPDNDMLAYYFSIAWRLLDH